MLQSISSEKKLVKPLKNGFFRPNLHKKGVIVGWLLKQQTTQNCPKLPKTIWNLPKPTEMIQNFLQPTTNYPELSKISLKKTDTPNKQPLNAFG